MRVETLLGALHDLRRDLNTSSDPRVGSARDNSSSTSVTASLTTGSNSASVSTLFVTFVPLLIYAVICVALFLTLRRLVPRAYIPRTFLKSLDLSDRSPPLPSGWFSWFKPFYQTPDTVVLNHSSLDGFLFLRYLKILCVICGVGVLLTWPILLPYHSHGGGGNIQLNLLTFGNVIHPTWYYLHAFLAWVYFGFVLYLVTRECIYFISLRQAYLCSPLYSGRLSSRTVLFTSVPHQILDERKIRKIFGDNVKNVWIPRDTEELDDLVKEREQTADRLEKAEILLIRKVNEAYIKAAKQGHPDIGRGSTESELSKEAKEALDAVSPASSLSPASPTSPTSPVSPFSPSPAQSPASPSSAREFVRSDGTPMMKASYGFAGPSPDINGSVAAQWVPYEQRPIHRPIANYGRRVDTIKWTRNRLKELAPKIAKLRSQYRKGRPDPLPAVFIEFQTQVDAQSAYQSLAHHRANHMVPETVGVRPQEIIWSSLRMAWWERIVRRFLVQGFIAVMVVFWSIPAAIVGIISNVSNLTSKVIFLRWIDKLPKIILSLIEGLLPAVALAALMAIVPMLMRACARQAGVPTESRVELFVQNSYFIFQVVQVFLVTTLTSAVSNQITSIIQDPSSVRSLLAQALPAASNFYISYFLLQGLAMSATRIVHLMSVFRHGLMSHSSGSPRLISQRYHRLRKIHWGSVYPVFTNLGVIALSYSLIAPLVLGFATIGLFLVYATYRYNLLYVYSSERDTRGLHYPRALKQTLAGVYLAEICMVGLFTFKNAFGPLVLMIGLIVFTILVNFSLNDALGPLLYNLPRTVAAEEALRKSGNSIFAAANLEDMHDNTIEDTEQQHTGYDSDFDPGNPTDQVSHGEQTARGVEGADRAVRLTRSTARAYARKQYEMSLIPAFIAKVDFWTRWISPDPAIKPNFLLTFLHPEIYADFHIFRQQVPDDILETTYEDSVLRDAYSPSSMRKRAPRLWIPRDVAGVSRQEVAHSSKVIDITDEGAWIEENGRLNVDLDGETSEWVSRGWEREKF